MTADNRLFVYGTLAPGEPNAHVMKAIDGSWEPATVNGRLYPEGWGATLGYPALVVDEDAEPVEGLLFTAENLVAHWPRLDAFEGEGYERVRTLVQRRDHSIVEAHVYVLKQD